jgi:membrane-associated phospholipid phosphatase
MEAMDGNNFPNGARGADQKTVWLFLNGGAATVSDAMSEPRLNPVSSRKVRLLCSARALCFTLLVSALALWGAFLLDETVLKLVRKHAHGWSGWLAQQVSFWGDSFGIAAISLLCWWQAKRRNALQWKRLVIVMALCSVLGGLSANVIRTLTGRARPNSGVAAGWYGPAKGLPLSKSAHAFQSFPSAHTGVVAGFCAPLGWVALRSRRRKILFLGLGLSLSGTALMAWARVWVGAHHLSDVLAAALSGWAIALAWLHYRAPELTLDPEHPDDGEPT